MRFDTYIIADQIREYGIPLDLVTELIQDKTEPNELFLIPGGNDIDPACYGEEPTYARFYNSEHDKFELAVVKAIIELKRPTVAICRGHQFIGAAVGAKLIQDLFSEGFYSHGHGPVYVEPGSLIEKIFRENMRNGVLEANSLHHQAVDETTLPTGWFVSSRAHDGVVEAIECSDLPIISVQWHPEIIWWQLRKMEEYLGHHTSG